MTETASLIIKVDSRGAKSATADLDNLTRAGGRAEKSAGALAGAWKVVGAVAASAALSQAVGMYIRLADASANMNSRLRLATKSQEEFNTAQAATYQIAQRTSTELGSVVDLYAKLSQSTGELGMTQGQVLQMTETITQAFQVSGATAQEAAGGLRQLGQAMAGGTLRAEEFNSIIESSPRIVQALADHFEVSFGKVRALVNDGKISSEQFAQAMLAASQKVQSEFDQMPLTVERASQQVRNALTRLVGDTEDSTGATRDLATAIQDLARTLESDEVKRAFASTVGGLNSIIQATLSASGYLDRLRGAMAGLELQGNAAFQSLNPMNWTRSGLQRLGAQYSRGTGFVENGWSAMQASEGVGVAIPDGARTGPRGRRTRATASEVAATAGQGKSVSAELQKEIDKIREQAQAYGLSRVELAKLNMERALATASNDAERDAIRGAHGELINAIAAEEAGTRAKAASTKASQERERATAALAQAYESYNQQLHRANELHGQNTEVARLNYEIQHGALKGISAAQAEVLREAAQWQDWLDEQADIARAWADGQQDHIDGMTKTWGKASDEMSEYAKQAARNMQDAFADFLFDPFENGVSGMLDSFVKTIRRMGAEMASSKLFDAMGQWGQANAGAGGWVGAMAGVAKGISSARGGGRAAGGPLMAGQGYVVGDGGVPELFVPGQSGTLYPVARGGGHERQQVVVHVHNAPAGTEVRESRAPGGGLQIDVMVKQMEGGMAGNVAMGASPFNRAFESRYGLRPVV